MDRKVVVTHWKALRAKYGGDGLARVRRAIEALVAADRERGLGTRVIGLDDAADMRPFRARPMGGVDDREGAKRTIDAIDRKLLPHYLMILGGPDVVPLQRLANLMGYVHAGGDGDQDLNVESDLPYACDMPFSTDTADFQGPTRAVGRLPDVPGSRNPGYLVKLLRHAAKAMPLDPEAYAAWFGVSAKAWKKSSLQTAERLFGDAKSLAMSPPATSGRWTREQLAPRLHFVNCHGDLDDPAYYGEGDGRQPEALRAARLRGRITPGTVLVAECCYGAQLYRPKARRGQAGIVYEYLRQGAYGVFGSTTIAYGPEDHNNYADVICRAFVERLRDGASLGRAALEARQEWVRHGNWTNPIKLKTLAQFYLLGDPSIHPIRKAGAAAAPVRRRAANLDRLVAEQRQRRRERLRQEGLALSATSQFLREEGVTPAVRDEMLGIADRFAMRGKLVRYFVLRAAKAQYDRGSRTARAQAAKEAVAMLVKEVKGVARARGPRYEVIVGLWREGRLVSSERVVSR